MHRPVRFADDIEPLVQFIEETDPSRILEVTLGKLRDGLSVKKLLTASALAVTRSSDLPPGHHGGPLHPRYGSIVARALVSPASDRVGRFECGRAAGRLTTTRRTVWVECRPTVPDRAAGV